MLRPLFPQVICNNLGGFGPEKSAPEQLHYRAVAQLHGHSVDAVRGMGSPRDETIPGFKVVRFFFRVSGMTPT